MNTNVNDRVLHVSFGQIKRILTIRILINSQIVLYMLWILIAMPKCTETKWEVGTEAWSRRYCINLLRQWSTKSGANTCAVLCSVVAWGKRRGLVCCGSDSRRKGPGGTLQAGWCGSVPVSHRSAGAPRARCCVVLRRSTRCYCSE